MKANLLEICYLIGSITFIMGLKWMGNAKTARKGNLLGAFGMTVAILGTIFLHNYEVSGMIYGLIFAAIAVGTAVGWYTAKSVQMTKMPELVSMFNGMGGACAALISLIEFHHPYELIHTAIEEGQNAETIRELIGTQVPTLLAIIAGLIIGSVSFSGSVIAFLKLNGTMNKPVRIPMYNIINNLVLIGLLGFGAYLVYSGGNYQLVWLCFAAAILYGVMFVIPIGGADMPVVISLLNSFTGLAAAFGGFLYDNKVMLTGGILVGSAGTLLTFVMCEAMNRSLANVIFGAFGGGSTATGSGPEVKGTIKDASVTDIAVMMNYSKKVVIVPGYGLAVAQAQHVIKELENILEERGVEVKYAIHPVAGRMPGHMNVLLAESNVSYDKLVEMDEINPEFEQTDVVLIVGANDVVNPAAKSDPSSPIYGMPILEVDKAKNIIVNKRSMNAGYAGIDNLLFYDPKCSMFFGDAKKALTELVAELKTMD
ncbi:MAG: NAD(P)(+) transhydrogenase (Re/Si-specific) subunit beta [Bacteroidia bacterium]|nr:NAD(P)(+) transhydrogenase (Re/Si-specific) subunit beta [Bacteroidia bacterium]